MSRKLKERREDSYMPGEEVFITWSDGSIFRVEVVANLNRGYTITKDRRIGPVGLGGIRYELRILEVLKIGDPSAFTTQPERGLEFDCCKIDNISGGDDWELTEKLASIKK